jgi:FkbM family methyltransferase
VYPNDIIGRAIYLNGMFEIAECRFVMSFLKPGMVFFDIGANLGQYTLLAAQQVGPTGKVHSFEPSDRMFKELTFNVTLNNFDDICRLNNLAISDTIGTARLSCRQAGAEVFGSLGDQDWVDGYPVTGYKDVQTFTLDEYMRQQDIEHVDLIKMDIEGAELPALRGGQQLLSEPQAPAIVLEMADVNTEGFGYKAMETWDYLLTMGYQMYRFDHDGRICGLADRPMDFTVSQNLVASKRIPIL